MSNDVEGVVLENAVEGAVGEKVVTDKLFSVVKDVEVGLSVVLGGTTLTVEALASLKEGEVLALDQLSTEPVDVMLNGELIARGSIVVVDDNFGLKLTEVSEF